MADSPLKKPALAVITLEQGSDGVAHAGLLLKDALQAMSLNELDVLQLSPASAGRTSARERARFASALFLSQLLTRDNWWMFNHVGIARSQNLIPKAIRRPYAVLLCGIEVWDPQLSDSRKRALRNATLRLAISNYTAKRVAAAQPNLGEIVTCPLALPRDSSSSTNFDSALLSHLRPESVLVVGRMSSVERYKGHDELINCWGEVLDHVPEAQLVVVGQGDDLSRLREKALTLGFQQSILFLGFVADGTLAALRERVALFALPSRGEGFGLVYLEAMRSGLACIGGANDAAADVITDNETGLVVDPLDGHALAQAIVSLLRSPETRARFGAAGKLRYEAEFTFDRYCSRLVPILAAAF